ncbi:hypothetical protein C0993_008078 [Termitomyces sp. T159_Od127]|nr:hypothetical protein C0993_008078 [Termitomyces sp. T159_Od127]
MADERNAADSVNHPVTSKGQAGKYKSAEFVEDSSDLEELPEDNLTRVSPETKFSRGKIKSKEPRTPLKSPLKKRRKTAANDNEGTVDGHTLTDSGSATKKSDESDNDMASLPDDSPKPKKARTSGDKSRIKKSKDEISDKHNATIKKLKSLVHACGVRKPWVKVFKDIPKPTQQIKKLREILTELGMTGRMSMEQAKRIRAEREIAQELADVKSFEQSMLKSSRGRVTEAVLRPSLKHADLEDEDSEEEDGPKHRRRKVTYRPSL